MLAVAIVFLAVLAPFVPSKRAVNAPTGGNDLSVDLGYQLNLGQSVLVRYMCYKLHPTGPDRDPQAHRSIST